jgi:tetratricopeptide (TPR) repeat protein
LKMKRMKRILIGGWLFGLLAVGVLAQQAPSSANSPTTKQAPTGQSPDQSQSSLPSQPQSGQAGASSNSPSNSPGSGSGTAAGQKPGQPDRPENADDANESSSYETRTDINPPTEDAKNHPNSKSAVEELDLTPPTDTTGVQEFHPWNPLKASKDVEVGDFYFRRKNYKAALERYKEALYYKENDAVATFRLAVCQEKLGDKSAARENFERYLKILPQGPSAKEARASLEKLGSTKTQ